MVSREYYEQYICGWPEHRDCSCELCLADDRDYGRTWRDDDGGR